MYKNVIIVGATGYFIGTKFTNAFLEKKDEFNTSILVSKRAMQDDEKKKILQDFEKRGAQLIFGELDDPVGLEKVRLQPLQGINAVICLVTGNDEKAVLDGQIALIEAAKRAHVTRFFTSDYGTELSRIRKGEFSYYDPKKRIQKKLESDLTLEHTFIATDILLSPSFGIDFKGRKITAFGPPNMKMSSIHSADIGPLVPEFLLADAEKIIGDKFEFTHESEEKSLQHLNSQDVLQRMTSFVKMFYSRGDGYSTRFILHFQRSKY